MVMSRVNVVVIGGGPAGLSAAIAASVDGASVILVDREARLGGILNQCIHDDFGIERYGERLAGPEYAFKDIKMLEQTNVFFLLQTSVSRISRSGNAFQLTLCNRHGIVQVEANSIVLATGCRERTAKEIAIHGGQPAGVITAGSAQYYINVLGQLPAKKCLILGSSNIGMIMARRLSLEGAKVLGVYEAKQIPGGSLRNVTQCLGDFNIPLHFGHTVTRVSGMQRLRGVEICRVDKNLNQIRGTENLVKFDTLILAVGLIPDNELADTLGIPLSNDTQGPICDQNFMTLVNGIYSCGNAMHINSMVDYISESGEIAGRSAARYMGNDRRLINVNASKDFLYSVPQCLDFDLLGTETVMFFRAREKREGTLVRVLVDGQEVFSQQYTMLHPPETERILVDFGDTLNVGSKVELRMEASK